MLGSMEAILAKPADDRQRGADADPTGFTTSSP
jgi:hypothetical protein